MKQAGLKSLQVWLKLNLGINKTRFYTLLLPDAMSKCYKAVVDNGKIPNKKLKAAFNSGVFDEIFAKKSYQLVKKHLSKQQRVALLQFLLDHLQELDNRGSIRLSHYIKVRHIADYKKDISSRELGRSLYNYILFLLRATLPKKFDVEGYFEFSKDKKEYMQRVVEQFAANSEMAHQEIYKLAASGNVFALLDAGDLAYHGINSCNKIDYQLAFDYYNQGMTTGKIHPGIIFTLALIYINYQEEGTNLADAYIIQLEGLTLEERLDVAVKYLRIGCYWEMGKFYNTLGLIHESDKIPMVLKQKYFSPKENAAYFYEKSMALNCVFAYINYADMIYSQLTEQNTWSFDERKAMCRHYVALYQQAAEIGHVIAFSKLAMMYYEGVSHLDEVYLKKDRQRAYHYLLKAVNGNSKFGKAYLDAYIFLMENYYLNASSTHFLEKSYQQMSAENAQILQTNIDAATRDKIQLLNQKIADLCELNIVL